MFGIPCYQQVQISNISGKARLKLTKNDSDELSFLIIWKDLAYLNRSLSLFLLWYTLPSINSWVAKIAGLGIFS